MFDSKKKLPYDLYIVLHGTVRESLVCKNMFTSFQNRNENGIKSEFAGRSTVWQVACYKIPPPPFVNSRRDKIVVIQL